MELIKGGLVAAVLSALAMAGWAFLGPWIPSALLAFAALGISGVCLYDFKWRFVLGYWAVQMLIFSFWFSGIMAWSRAIPAQ